MADANCQALILNDVESEGREFPRLEQLGE